MTFTVVVEPEAKADLLRLYEYLVDRAEYVEDLDVADRALQTIDATLGALGRTPFLFRKEVRAARSAASWSFLSELLTTL